MLNINKTCWLNETSLFFDQSWLFWNIKASSCMIVFKFWSRNCAIYNIISKKNFNLIDSYTTNWLQHVKRFLHVSMHISNCSIAWSIWSMIYNHSSSFSANHIHIRSKIISQKSLTTSIDVIASVIAEDNLSFVFDCDQIQMNRAFYTIEKKMILIEIERSYHTIQNSTMKKRNVASYATELIVNQSIIFEKNEMHQKHDWKNVSTNHSTDQIINQKRTKTNKCFNIWLIISAVMRALILMLNLMMN